MTSPIVPPHRPRITLDGPLLAQLEAFQVATVPVKLVGIRGYYRDTLGARGVNDVGLYDDAIVLVAPNQFVTFNANTDPSRLHPGVAVLEAGRVYQYKLGIHGLSKPPDQRYKALVQAAPVIVRRHEGRRESGLFGINIHRGGYQTTGSEGCQTIHPRQWPAFISLIHQALEDAAQAQLPYLLLDAAALAPSTSPPPTPEA